MSDEQLQQDEQQVRVWDLAVRVFHWSLVFFFFLTYASGEGDETLHAYAGYVVIALIAFRIVWGFIGSKHARFTDFLRGPGATTGYLRSFLSGTPQHYLGHNPVGGWMAVLLMVSILGACWSGLELYAAEGKGPLASQSDFIINQAHANGDEDDDSKAKQRKKKKTNEADEEYWEDIHETLANLALLLVIMHISGVLIASKVHHEKLIRAMISGYKIVKKP